MVGIRNPGIRQLVDLVECPCVLAVGGVNGLQEQATCHLDAREISRVVQGRQRDHVADRLHD
jgi:hypothetical protein